MTDFDGKVVLITGCGRARGEIAQDVKELKPLTARVVALEMRMDALEKKPKAK